MLIEWISTPRDQSQKVSPVFVPNRAKNTKKGQHEHQNTKVEQNVWQTLFESFVPSFLASQQPIQLYLSILRHSTNIPTGMHSQLCLTHS